MESRIESLIHRKSNLINDKNVSKLVFDKKKKLSFQLWGNKGSHMLCLIIIATTYSFKQTHDKWKFRLLKLKE